MEPDPRFVQQPRSFWAQVRLLSEQLGYSERGSRRLRRYSIGEVHSAFATRSLSTEHLGPIENPSLEATLIVDYLNYRAEALELEAQPNLMDREGARLLFEEIRSSMPQARCKLPMNKQKGDKRHYAYLTCIVNLLTEQALGAGRSFVDDPRGLITFTDEGRPTRTFARRMDGAYPTLNNPHACWEIKEYYGTTTFGSRVSGGVYETLLDGAEIEELRENADVPVLHYLIVDDYFTWWDCGRSYLCRMVDMVNSGSVDEVIFGRQVLDRWPKIVKSWLQVENR